MPEIHITRTYEAPVEEVWKAWTEPERLAQWWGRRGWNAVPDSIVIEPWPGGSFRVTTVNADGAEMTTEGTFAEVVPHERLVFSEGRVTFTDLGDGRTQMTFRATSPSAEAPAGVASAFDRLAEHLSPERTSP
jgi:uncharacterized protein YndB with AHSA1/START domain